MFKRKIPRNRKVSGVFLLAQKKYRIVLVWEVGEQDGDVDTQRLSDQCTLFDGDAVFTAFNASIVGAADLTNFSELFLAATFSFPKFSQIISKIVIDFIW